VAPTERGSNRLSGRGLQTKGSERVRGKLPCLQLPAQQPRASERTLSAQLGKISKFRTLDRVCCNLFMG
jgi:hypothetical protein